MKSVSLSFAFFIVLALYVIFSSQSVDARQVNLNDIALPLKILYTVTASAGSNGSVSPGKVTVSSGESASFKATADDGYEVDEWFVDGERVKQGGNTLTVSDIRADHSIYVTFELLRYTITATAGSNGSVYPAERIVDYGESATFAATADSGYVVDTWYLDGDDVQVGGASYTIRNTDEDYSLHVTFRKALSYSLGDLDFEEDEEFETRTVSNNVINPDQPQASRIHIRRALGFGLAGGGGMVMYNLKDVDPTSVTFGRIINARVKGSFMKTGADRILIRFKYLFATSEPDVELVVYLSDRRELLAPNDPLRPEHYLEVARVPAPHFPRPGSAGSRRFGLFKKVVWTGHLDFSEALYIELELVQPPTNGALLTNRVQAAAAGLSGAPSVHTALKANAGSATYIDSWSPAVQCYGICLDINWDNFVDEADFLMVVGGCGLTATGEAACMDGALSTDGYMDSYDVISWDWALNSDQRLLNYCGVPLVSATSTSLSLMSADTTKEVAADASRMFVDLPVPLSDLLIAGKSGAPDAQSKLKDRLYVFDTDGLYGGFSEPLSDRCNIRLIQGPSGGLYQLNSETGLLRLDSSNTVVIPPGQVRLTDIKDPRYNMAATVYVGIQDRGADSFGRPLLDAAFDDEFVYVVPVVVSPDGSEPYSAAAKLRLLDGGNPPYEVVALYDDPPLANDNQYRDSLRELELDGAGNLYVLNVHAINESDILWRYSPDGSIERIDLGWPDGGSYVPAPVAMFASKTTEMLYLTSAIYNPADPDSTVIYGFSTQGPLALERLVTISDLHHVTCMTEDPVTGTLWVAGFNMYGIPAYPNPHQQAFYYPYLARVLPGSDQAQRISLYDSDAHDLALPISMLWTAPSSQTLSTPNMMQ